MDPSVDAGERLAGHGPQREQSLRELVAERARAVAAKTARVLAGRRASDVVMLGHRWRDPAQTPPRARPAPGLIPTPERSLLDREIVRGHRADTPPTSAHTRARKIRACS